VGQVTLVGDAAHLIPPFHGQGSSMALEDVLQLARSLSQQGLTAAALRGYEEARPPRNTRVQKFEFENPFTFVYEDPEYERYLMGITFDPLVPSGLSAV
jgi:2-polyprenyl-6-methoxyphenol hydroxylase-like FAD-dependent oxidoreductase